MKNIFGAFSAAPANLKLKNGYTLFDWAMRQHCFPAFWGRSLTGANAITTDEVAFLKAKNCKVCLILDDVTELEISGCNGTEEAMRADAANLGMSGILAFLILQTSQKVYL